MFKAKDIKSAKRRFAHLYNNRDKFPYEVKRFLNNLKNQEEEAFLDFENELIPNTNNLCELVNRVTFPKKIKKIFKTTEGAEVRMSLNDLRWFKRNVLGEKHRVTKKEEQEKENMIQDIMSLSKNLNEELVKI